MILYRRFGFLDEIEIPKEQRSFLGSRSRPAYENRDSFYKAVAEFASSCGDKLVSITGSPQAESARAYWDGEMVVWYRAA